jgi:threonine synthase
MLGVQAAGAAAVNDAWAEDLPLAEVEPRYPAAETLADSIAVTHPHNGERALEAVRASGGAVTAVDDGGISEAMLALSRSGVLVEAASAATLAGIRAALADGVIERDARVVAVGTGSGLKSLDFVASLLGPPPSSIEPTLDALVAYLDG